MGLAPMIDKYWTLLQHEEELKALPEKQSFHPKAAKKKAEGLPVPFLASGF